MGKHTPRMDKGTATDENLQQCVTEASHPLTAVANVMVMLITGSRDVITRFLARPVRWPVPRQPTLPPPSHEFLLAQGQLAPNVIGFAHVWVSILTLPPVRRSPKVHPSGYFDALDPMHSDCQSPYESRIGPVP